MRKFFVLFFLCFLTFKAKSEGLYLYFGYWSKPQNHQEKIVLQMPNYYLISKNQRNIKFTDFYADKTPILTPSDIIEVKAMSHSFGPLNNGMLIIKLTPSGMNSFKKFFNAWTENKNPGKRNIIFVSGGEAKTIYEVDVVTPSIDRINLITGNRREAIELENTFKKQITK